MARDDPHPSPLPGGEGEEVTLGEALARAVALLRNEQLDDAEALLAQIREAVPDDPDALHFQGVLRHAQGRTDDGIALIRASLASLETQPGAWNNLGNLLVHAQRFDEAARAYDTCVRHADSNPGGDSAAADALNNLAILQRRHGRWIESEGSARRAIALRPDFGDAWYNLSLALMGQQRVHEGLVASSHAITLGPRQTLGRSQVIRALTLLGEREQAAQLYREWLAEEPDNPVVQHMLAACDDAPGAAPPRASDAYVETVFDAYAESFDASLERLHYRAPELVAHELQRLLAAPSAALAIVDAGCGTGLCGPLLRPWAARLAGCDLSVGMLRRAKARGCYDVLHKAELSHYLATQPGAFDVVVSADTLCYFGDLHEVLAASARALRPGGRLMFTVEALDDADLEPLRLQATGRYAHARAHLHASLEAAGFAELRIEPAVSRTEGGRDVAGWLASARKAP
ncbi:MAG TPA: methyltransferase domain-containing protein [Burkholderiaceae bacterium]